MDSLRCLGRVFGCGELQYTMIFWLAWQYNAAALKENASTGCTSRSITVMLSDCDGKLYMSCARVMFTESARNCFFVFIGNMFVLKAISTIKEKQYYRRCFPIAKKKGNYLYCCQMFRTGRFTPFSSRLSYKCLRHWKKYSAVDPPFRKEGKDRGHFRP